MKERRRSIRSTRAAGKSVSYADPSSDFSEEGGKDEDEDEGKDGGSSAGADSEDDFEVRFGSGLECRGKVSDFVPHDVSPLR